VTHKRIERAQSITFRGRQQGESVIEIPSGSAGPAAAIFVGRRKLSIVWHK